MNTPTLLMVHGMMGSLDYFDPAGRITNAEVRTPDLLGYGSLRHVEQDRLTLDAQAEHVASQMASAPSTPVWLLGHSMGGAVAMLAADRRPELVRAIINVEGNFTLKDAFWSRDIVTKSLRDWSNEYRTYQQDVRAWTVRCGIEPTEQRIDWMTGILEHQPAGTIYAMAKAIMKETSDPGYLDVVRRVIERDVPIHLIAGAQSVEDWGIPDFVRGAGRSYTEIPGTGHLMMLEEPAAFCRAVDAIIASA
jgi:pimeloyl-ACP methyl ester carboxylesterase